MLHQRMFGLLAIAAMSVAVPMSSHAGSFVPGRGSFPSPSAPSLPVVPPVALQQIKTASEPYRLPLPQAALDENASPQNSAAMTAMLADLDSGIGNWLRIAPGAGFDRLPPSGFTLIAPSQPAKHSQPAPPIGEVKLGAFLAIEAPPELHRSGVPGLESGASASGNRALWFSAGH